MSKEESKMLQGISVLAMVCLHLFDNLNYSDFIYALDYAQGIPLDFLFCTAFGFLRYGICLLQRLCTHEIVSAKELLQKKTDKLIVSLLQFLDNSSFVYLDQRRQRVRLILCREIL